MFGAVAQLVARFVRIEEVRGSIPRSSTMFVQVKVGFDHYEINLRVFLPPNCPQDPESRRDLG